MRELKQKLFAQIDESAKVTIKKNLLSLSIIKHPLPYDSTYVKQSAVNMISSLFHIGFYAPNLQIQTDTMGYKIKTTYLINPGKKTKIRNVVYDFTFDSISAYKSLFTKASFLQANNSISKLDVLKETNRLVDSFRNNGYYRFNASNIRTFGDTTNLQGFNPSIDLKISIVPSGDSSALKSFFIKRMYIIPDYQENAQYLKSKKEKLVGDLIVNQSMNLFHPSIFNNWITTETKGLYKQQKINEILFSLNKSGVWRSINMKFDHDSVDPTQVNLYLLLNPANKYNIETTLELSYAASSTTGNVLGGNLFGLSGNLGVTNRNLFHRAIRMSHNFRAGIELNNNAGSRSQFINSNELSYLNSVNFQKLIFPSIPQLLNRKNRNLRGETFINAGTNFVTRFNLFNLQTTKLSMGWTGVNPSDWQWSWSIFNFGYSNVFNRTDSFNNILDNNPFLRFSYNTALVNGMSVSFFKNVNRTRHPNSMQKEESFRFNAEESGLTWGALPVLKKYKRRFIKLDGEIKQTMLYNKSSLVLRAFTGIGFPLMGVDSNRTLPFFKQYFGGGSNSMRAWPVRGIGPGGRPLIPYTSNQTAFNDRTGDIQLELNAEYRYNIIEIIPNTLSLKGAVFTDIGNIWNMRNTNLSGGQDSTQFNFKNFYSQIGVAAGTGIRLDFSYFVLRLDLAFRVKRPELYKEKNGWKLPSMGFDDFLKKTFTRGKDDEYRKWRYENFNFSIGIGYAF